LLPSLSTPFFQSFADQARADAKTANVSLEIIDAQLSDTMQASAVESALSRGVDALIIFPTSGVPPGAIQEAINKGVPTIMVGRPVVGVTGQLAQVREDDAAAGRILGGFINQKFPDGAKVLRIENFAESDLNSGLRQTLSGSSTLEAATVGNSLPQNAPDIVVADRNDLALDALNHFGADKPLVFGLGATSDALRQIEGGALAGTVEFYPEQQSHISMKLAIDTILHKTSPAQNVIWVTPNVITKSNLSAVYSLGDGGVQVVGGNGCDACTKDQVCCRGACSKSCTIAPILEP
jgi:ABC-type sugar transport system substrate-binding protein